MPRERRQVRRITIAIQAAKTHGVPRERHLTNADMHRQRSGIERMRSRARRPHLMWARWSASYNRLIAADAATATPSPA